MRNKETYIQSYERFMSKVDTTPGQGTSDCWTWTASVRNKDRSNNRYGAFSLNGKNYIATRFIYEFFYGPIPLYEGKEKLYVLHRCNNSQCVKISHLYLDNNAQNVKDKLESGRQTSKLNKEQVLEVLEMYKSGFFTRKSIAEKYKIHSSTISNIINRKTWKHLAV